MHTDATESSLTIRNNLPAADRVIVGIQPIIASVRHKYEEAVVERDKYSRVGVEKEDRDRSNVVAVVVDQTTSSKASVEECSWSTMSGRGFKGGWRNHLPCPYCVPLMYPRSPPLSEPSESEVSSGASSVSSSPSGLRATIGILFRETSRR